MKAVTFDNFQVDTEVSRTEWFTAFRVHQVDNGQILRLTRISSELSESTAFRAAFRKDESSLSSLHHPGILSIVGWGEDNGQLFYLTEYPVGRSLEQWLAGGESLDWDEFTDIGWQLASAIQHAHNLGMTHGRLSLKSVMLSDELKARVAGFGLYRWIAARSRGAEPEPELSELVRHDLIEFGRVLQVLLQAVPAEAASTANAEQVAEIQNLIERLKKPPLDFRARDVQGLLGNMLLATSGESIEMIDHRKGQGLSRHSIVDELFDEPSESTSTVRRPPPLSADRAAGPGRRLLIVFLTASLLLALYLLLKP